MDQEVMQQKAVSLENPIEEAKICIAFTFIEAFNYFDLSENYQELINETYCPSLEESNILIKII